MRKNSQFIREIGIDPVPLAIAKLSRYYREADGSPEGSDMRYWLRAEAEVLRALGLAHPDEPWMAAGLRNTGSRSGH